jgi:hypothetical protein
LHNDLGATSDRAPAKAKTPLPEGISSQFAKIMRCQIFATGPQRHQHFGGQKGLPSKQKPSVGVIFPEVVQT